MASRRHVRILAGLLDRTAGSHTYHVSLANRLISMGYKVSMIAFGVSNDLDSRCELTVIPRKRLSLPILWRFETIYSWLDCFFQVYFSNLRQPDVVICGEHLFAVAHTQKFPEVPWIYLPHSLVLRDELDGYLLASNLQYSTMLWTYVSIQKWSMRHALYTVRFTKYACDKLRECYKDRCQARFAIIPIGIAQSDVRRPRYQRKKLRFLTVASLNKRKNVQFSLQALSSLTAYDWAFDVVGGGDQLTSLQALCSQLGISDRITFHGHVNDPERWYEECDVLLSASKSESLGLTILEAMSHGMAVVAMKADGVEFSNPNEELIVDGETGFLVGSEFECVSKLEHLLKDYDEVFRIGIAGKQIVSVRNTWRLHLKRYEQLFDEMAVPKP